MTAATTRRGALGAAGALLASAAILPKAALASGRQRILILGGTNFVGPHLVHGAQIAGHEVTLFNRGITNVHLFPGVEKLRGDRTLDGGLAALQGNRTWDVVIDTWQAHPKAVHAATALLAGRTGSYVYVSSIAVYGGFRKTGLTEADPILPLAGAPALDDPTIGYVWAKRLGEAALDANLKDTAGIVVRGSSIWGYDYSKLPTNQNAYWPLRVRAGGDVVAPGDGSDLVQWSDAAALADLAIKLGVEQRAGAVNAVNPPVSFRDLLETCKARANPAANLVWVPQSVMQANGGTPFEVVPMWIPADDPEPGFFRLSGEKARASGMRIEPLDYAVDHILKSYRGTAPDFQPAWRSVNGMPREVEQRILSAYRAGK